MPTDEPYSVLLGRFCVNFERVGLVDASRIIQETVKSGDLSEDDNELICRAITTALQEAIPQNMVDPDGGISRSKRGRNMKLDRAITEIPWLRKIRKQLLGSFEEWARQQRQKQEEQQQQTRK